MDIRVRFAPSPTGFLHIGSLRTALYNFLFARRHGGKTILRIEDTDQTRYVEGAEQELISTCRWAGIEFDESPEKGGEYGPYRQSERTELYRQHAQILLDNGTAYYAFDTSEDLDAMRLRQQAAGIAPKYDRSTMRNQFTLGAEETARLMNSGAERVVRLKTPLQSEIAFDDVVRGRVVFHSREIDDQVLLKSDGFPTYHLANIVDDRLMKITHVIRGEEWLPSTPKHILLYQSFGWEPPKFAHLPLLLNEDRSKMSKRKGDVFVYQFREKGFFPESLVNFVALLGWNPTADREVFSMQEMMESFTLEKVNKAGAIFDYKKLEWMQSEYMKLTSPGLMVAEVVKALEQENISCDDVDYIEKIIVLFRERILFPNQLASFADYMFILPQQWDEEYLQKIWTSDTAKNMDPIIKILRQSDDYNHVALHSAIKDCLKALGIGFRDVMNPLRLMITGKSVGAGMMETLELLGKEKTLARIDGFVSAHKGLWQNQ